MQLSVEMHIIDVNVNRLILKALLCGVGLLIKCLCMLGGFSLAEKVMRVAGASTGLGQTSDLNGAAIFLASRAADYVRAVTLPVDGDWLTH